MNQEQIIAIAKQTIDTESKAIAHLSSLVDETFAKAVQYIYESENMANTKNNQTIKHLPSYAF